MKLRRPGRGGNPHAAHHSQNRRNAARPRGARKSFAALVLSGFLLAGCASLPTSGTPTEFALETPAVTPIDQSASGPQDNSTPQQLVSDFLQACAASAGGDFLTAREYLTQSASTSWDPNAAVFVYQTDQALELVENDQGDAAVTILIEPTISATVDSAGVYEYQAENPAMAFQFSLEQNEDGQWRISALPDGLLLSESSFQSNYECANLYFVSQDRQTLVADPRWYARSEEASYLVEKLLDGPSENVASGVDSYGSSANLSLDMRGVEIVDGVATVALTGNVSTNAEERRLLAWQIAETLRQLDQITSVVVTLNAVEIESASGISFDLERFVAVSGEAVIVGETTDLSETEIIEVGQSATFAAVGPAETNPVAWVVGDQVVIRTDGQAASDRTAGEDADDEVADTGLVQVTLPGASAPSVDRTGLVWTTASSGVDGDSEAAETDGSPRIYLIASDGQVTVLESPIATAQSLDKIAISPNGAFAAILATVDGTQTLWLATVNRDEGISLEAVRQVETVAPAVTDCSWQGADSLLVLRQSSESQALALYQIGIDAAASTVNTSIPTGSTQISATPSKVFLLTAEHQLYQNSGTAWRNMGSDYQSFATAN